MSNPILTAAGLLGSQMALAKLLEISPGAVSQWASGDRPVPIERCVAIEVATAGAVTRRDLRPEDWHRIWPELVSDLHPAPEKKVEGAPAVEVAEAGHAG